MTATVPIDRQALDALLCAAFEGEPGIGRREVRLSPDESDYLRSVWPAARLAPMAPPDGDGKRWYLLSFTHT